MQVYYTRTESTVFHSSTQKTEKPFSKKKKLKLKRMKHVNIFYHFKIGL